MKTIFDRFAVEGLMNAAECCQALSEAGLVAPRREFVKHLKSRKHIGTSRSVSFFEFMRAFAAIRGPVAGDGGRRSSRRDAGPGLLASEMRVGAEIEADYRRSGKYYAGTITRVNRDNTVDIKYDDGETELDMEPSSVRQRKRADLVRSDGRPTRDRRDDDDYRRGDRDRDHDRDRDRSRRDERDDDRLDRSRSRPRHEENMDYYRRDRDQDADHDRRGRDRDDDRVFPRSRSRDRGWNDRDGRRSRSRSRSRDRGRDHSRSRDKARDRSRSRSRSRERDSRRSRDRRDDSRSRATKSRFRKGDHVKLKRCLLEPLCREIYGTSAPRQ